MAIDSEDPGAYLFDKIFGRLRSLDLFCPFPSMCLFLVVRSHRTCSLARALKMTLDGPRFSFIASLDRCTVLASAISCRNLFPSMSA